MPYKVDTQITNPELRRVFLEAIRDGAFNLEDLKVFLRNVYKRIESDHPTSSKWAYDYVSRRYTDQVGQELKEQRRLNARNITDTYEGVYNEL